MRLVTPTSSRTLRPDTQRATPCDVHLTLAPSGRHDGHVDALSILLLKYESVGQMEESLRSIVALRDDAIIH